MYITMHQTIVLLYCDSLLIILLRMQPESTLVKNKISEEPAQPIESQTPQDHNTIPTNKSEIPQKTPSPMTQPLVMSQNWEVKYNASSGHFELEKEERRQAQKSPDLQVQSKGAPQPLQTHSQEAHKTESIKLPEEVLHQQQEHKVIPQEIANQTAQVQPTKRLKSQHWEVTYSESKGGFGVTPIGSLIVKEPDQIAAIDKEQVKQPPTYEKHSQINPVQEVEKAIEVKIQPAQEHTSQQKLASAQQQTVPQNVKEPSNAQQINNVEAEVKQANPAQSLQQEPIAPQVPLLENNSKISEQVKALKTQGNDSLYEINVMPPAAQLNTEPQRFVEFEEFPQKQDQQIQTQTIQHQEPASLVPKQYWEVFYMGSGFEINKREKFTDLEKLNRAIQEERRRLEQLNLREQVLPLPQKQNPDDHKLERESNKQRSVSEHSDKGLMNKTALEHYDVEKVVKGYDTEEDLQLKEEKQIQAQEELQAIEANRLLPVKMQKKSKASNLESGNIVNSKDQAAIIKSQKKSNKDVAVEENRKKTQQLRIHNDLSIQANDKIEDLQSKQPENIVGIVEGEPQKLTIEAKQHIASEIKVQSQKKSEHPPIQILKVDNVHKPLEKSSHKSEKEQQQHQNKQQHQGQVKKVEEFKDLSYHSLQKTEDPKQEQKNQQKELKFSQTHSKSLKQQDIQVLRDQQKLSHENSQTPGIDKIPHQETHQVEEFSHEIPSVSQTLQGKQPSLKSLPHDQEVKSKHTIEVGLSEKQPNQKRAEEIKIEPQPSQKGAKLQVQSELKSQSMAKEPLKEASESPSKKQKTKMKLDLKQSQQSFYTEEQQNSARNSHRSRKSRSSSRVSEIQKRIQSFKMASVVNVTVQNQSIIPKINRAALLNQKPELESPFNQTTLHEPITNSQAVAEKFSELPDGVSASAMSEIHGASTKTKHEERSIAHPQQRIAANKPDAIQGIDHKSESYRQKSQKKENPVQQINQLKEKKTDEQKLPDKVKEIFLKAAKAAKESSKQRNPPMTVEAKPQIVEDKINAQSVVFSQPHVEQTKQQKEKPKAAASPVEQKQIPVSPMKLPEVDPDKEAMKQEISELKKTVEQIKKQIVTQKSLSRLAPIQSLPSYRIQGAHSINTPIVEPQVNRTSSIIQYYERNKHAIEYPDVAEIHTDQKEPEPKSTSTPHKMYWHSEKRKAPENIGKIFHRKFSQKKTLQFTMSPAKQDRQQFRIRPFLSKISSNQDKPSDPIDLSFPEGFATGSSGFSQIKPKLSKDDLIEKINVNEHNFRRFVKAKSNIAVPPESKQLSNSAFINMKRKPAKQPQNMFSDLAKSEFQNLRQSSSNKVLANPQQEIKSLLYNPRSPIRNPLPKDSSFQIEPERYASQLQKTVNAPQRSSQVLTKVMSDRPTAPYNPVDTKQSKPARKQNAGNISRIEDEPSQHILQDVEDKFMDFPVLPRTPSATMNSEDLIQLGRQTFEVFGITIDQDTVLNIKKYRNCVYFNALDKHILWHYTGKFYIGGWSMNSKSPEGEKVGQGIEFYPEKYIYEGDFNEGKRHGQGTMRSNFRDIYTGQWSRGLRHGHGILRQANGATYQGEWKQGKKDGYGKQIVAPNDIYEGLFENGSKNGFGKQIFPNGDRYEGNYQQNKFSGKGAYYWSDGSFYEGEFENGMRQGRGIWKSNQTKGDVYEGEYKNDKKHGKGKYTWENGVVYTGQFENDLRHGEGIIKDEKGTVHRAIWENGILKNKLYLQQQRKLKEPKAKRTSADPKKDRSNSNSNKLEGQVPLQKRRSSLYQASISKINESAHQLSHLSSTLRQHPYKDVQQPRMVIENL